MENFEPNDGSLEVESIRTFDPETLTVGQRRALDEESYEEHLRVTRAQYSPRPGREDARRLDEGRPESDDA